MSQLAAVATVKGGFGSTTTALAVAAGLAELGSTLLVEGDASGGSLLGCCAGLAPVPTLEQVAMATRDRPSVDALVGIAQSLGRLQVAAAPADPFRAHLVMAQPRAPWQLTLRDVPGWVVVDVGRVQPASPAWSLLRLADVVLLVSSPTPMAVAATLEWAVERGRVAPGAEGLAVDACRLVVIAPPRRRRDAYDPSALQGELGDRLAGWLPWEPDAVDLLQRGASLGHRALRRTALADAARSLAGRLDRTLATT